MPLELLELDELELLELLEELEVELEELLVLEELLLEELVEEVELVDELLELELDEEEELEVWPPQADSANARQAIAKGLFMVVTVFVRIVPRGPGWIVPLGTRSARIL